MTTIGCAPLARDVDARRDRPEPGQAVGVAQRCAVRHLLDIGGRMQAVAFDQRPVELLGQQRATVLLPAPVTPMTTIGGPLIVRHRQDLLLGLGDGRRNQRRMAEITLSAKLLLAARAEAGIERRRQRHHRNGALDRGLDGPAAFAGVVHLAGEVA